MPNSTSMFASRADDGTESITTADEQRFLDWLRANGAVFPKIQWPARTTVANVRGTVALDDIAGGEKMLCIPSKLIMSPVTARHAKDIGHVFCSPESFKKFRSDGTYETVVFLMHEKLLGERSFWYPYIATLPEPRTAGDWTAQEIAELQNSMFAEDVAEYQQVVESKYSNLFEHLRALFPDTFPKSQYTLELFRWAYLTVMARAFGRRIDYMSLVPFADMLNHGSVRVKYDLNTDGNDMFRLFPSPGSPGYKKGAEVFNSYGRRDNEHLLLHYGFAMPKNEWDTYSIVLNIDTLLRHKQHHPRRRALSSDSESDEMMDGTEDDEPDAKRRMLQTRLKRLARFMRPRTKFEIRDAVFQWQLLRLYRLANIDPFDDSSAALCDLSLGQLSSRIDLPINAAIEKQTLLHMMSDLSSLTDNWHSTTEQDEHDLQRLDVPGEDVVKPGVQPMRLRSALHYRLQRKRLIQHQVNRCQLLFTALSGAELSLEKVAHMAALAKAQLEEEDRLDTESYSATGEARWKRHYKSEARRELVKWSEEVHKWSPQSESTSNSRGSIPEQ